MSGPKAPRLALAGCLLLGAAAGCDAGGCGGADGAEAYARGALARDGWTEVELTPVEGHPGELDVRGVREGRACEGTIVVRGEEGRRTSALSSYCP